MRPAVDQPHAPDNAANSAFRYTAPMFRSRPGWATLLAALLAASAGCAVAWMDTRPGWDDTGVTAGALFLGSGLAAVAGVRWWLAALLVAAPLLAVEIRGLGWGAGLVLAFALAGAAGGAIARRAMRGDRT